MWTGKSPRNRPEATGADLWWGRKPRKAAVQEARLGGGAVGHAANNRALVMPRGPTARSWGACVCVVLPWGLGAALRGGRLAHAPAGDAPHAVLLETQGEADAEPRPGPRKPAPRGPSARGPERPGSMSGARRPPARPAWTLCRGTRETGAGNALGERPGPAVTESEPRDSRLPLRLTGPSLEESLPPFCSFSALREGAREQAGSEGRHPPAPPVPRDQLGRAGKEGDRPAVQAQSGKKQPGRDPCPREGGTGPTLHCGRRAELDASPPGVGDESPSPTLSPSLSRAPNARGGPRHTGPRPGAARGADERAGTGHPQSRPSAPSTVPGPWRRKGRGQAWARHLSEGASPRARDLVAGHTGSCWNAHGGMPSCERH